MADFEEDFNININALNEVLGVDNGADDEDADGPNADPARAKERHFERRVKSELALEQSLPWHLENGASYHCLSFGDVDSLTYLRTIVKQQPLEYVLISTWCLAMTDAEELKKWLDAGYIKRVDIYAGEIFTKQYAPVYNFLLQNCLVDGARVAIFRNHSKVIAGFGRDFDFAIAGSANINSNPRCENMTITCNTDVAMFYKEFYDGIKSFSRDCRDWKVWQRGA